MGIILITVHRNGNVLRPGEISYSDAVELAEADFRALAKVAGEYTRREIGEAITFVNNIVVNYSNVCVAKCPFCAFYRLPGAEGGYTRSAGDVVKVVREAHTVMGVTELHINGGFNPELTIEYFEDLFSAVKRSSPITIKGLTMAEVDYYSRRWRMSYRELLERLKSAGLDAIAGGGAEIFSEEVRRVISPNKAAGETWLRIAEVAHDMGIPSNATMLYGHVEDVRHIVDHILRVRELQERTGGIMMFIPVKFVPWNTELYRSGKVGGPAPPTLDVKVVALARIILGATVRKIGAYWLSVGKRLASTLLNAGANDLVGTMINESVLSSAGAQERTTVDELAHIAREAGGRPALRDTFHRIIRYF